MTARDDNSPAKQNRTLNLVPSAGSVGLIAPQLHFEWMLQAIGRQLTAAHQPPAKGKDEALDRVA